MDVFRNSFFKSSTWKVCKVPSIIFICVLLLFYERLFFWHWGGNEWLAFLLIILLISPVLVSFLMLLFYIEIYDEKIVLVNGVFKSWRKSFLYSEYSFCRIEYNRGHLVNIIKMRKYDKDNIFPYYGLDLVNPKDLKKIISILESKGVVVITKDLKEV